MNTRDNEGTDLRKADTSKSYSTYKPQISFLSFSFLFPPFPSFIHIYYLLWCFLCSTKYKISIWVIFFFFCFSDRVVAFVPQQSKCSGLIFLVFGVWVVSVLVLGFRVFCHLRYNLCSVKFTPVLWVLINS